MSVVEKAINKLRRTGAGIDVTRSSASDAEPLPTTADEPKTVEVQPRIFVDRDVLQSLGYLPDTQQNRRFADEYRHIKRPLITTAKGGDSNLRLIMMASALPGDGKTFTSVNLALSIARERDTTVVLVDADVAKPHISRLFGVEQELGLLDALANPLLDIEQLVLPTDIKGLSILPGGKPRDNATELLASARMKEIVSRLAGRSSHPIVLLDSPPLLVSSESRALCAAVGQVALVVHAGRTPRQAVVDAIGLIGEGKPIGLILNQGRSSFSEGLYGYAYGYGYGNNAYSGSYGDSREEAPTN